MKFDAELARKVIWDWDVNVEGRATGLAKTAILRAAGCATSSKLVDSSRIPCKMSRLTGISAWIRRFIFIFDSHDEGEKLNI
jgi:hypothetical protein